MRRRRFLARPSLVIPISGWSFLLLVPLVLVPVLARSMVLVLVLLLLVLLRLVLLLRRTQSTESHAEMLMLLNPPVTRTKTWRL